MIKYLLPILLILPAFAFGQTDEMISPPPPPPPPPMAVDNMEIFKIVEDMPIFPGCEDENSQQERRNCSSNKLNEFIRQNLVYPESAKQNKVEGSVVVQFVVFKDGSIDNINVVRDIGHGCGEEAKRVIALMRNMDQGWFPGRQRGKKVNVIMTQPIQFKL